MPIEIKELTVRFVINEKNNTFFSQPSTTNSNLKILKQEDKKRIIEECVDKVLEILERNKER